VTSPDALSERDLDLVVRVARGDEAAFDELVRKHQYSVFNTIHRYVGDRSAADDIAQEVFVIVWNKAGTFKGKSSFATWLYRIVVNQCLQFRRRRQRRPAAISIDAMDAESPPDALQVGDGREQAERTAAVRQALAELPDRQRIALVLSHYEGHTYSEIAEMMGTSVPSVESLIFRAKDELRRKLIRLRSGQ
jgi:RNA polymerase sigma-70 factor (ECF subfamily)